MSGATRGLIGCEGSIWFGAVGGVIPAGGKGAGAGSGAEPGGAGSGAGREGSVGSAGVGTGTGESTGGVGAGIGTDGSMGSAGGGAGVSALGTGTGTEGSIGRGGRGAPVGSAGTASTRATDAESATKAAIAHAIRTESAASRDAFRFSFKRFLPPAEVLPETVNGQLREAERLKRTAWRRVDPRRLRPPQPDEED